MTDKPHSAASERNRDPILAVLRAHFADRTRVLEVGSGTGQHAVYFSAALPRLLWQSSDRAENLPGIRAWVGAGSERLPPPIEFDVAGRWPAQRFDAIFSANTLHIMSWNDVEALFGGLPAITSADAKLVIYGPFNRDGAYTSASNAAFDAMLRADAPHRGIRDAAAVDALALRAGFVLSDEVPMPANNLCRVWQRTLPLPQ